MGQFRQFSFAIALIFLGVIAFGPNASAATTGGIGGRPANPDSSNPRTQSIFILNANKGETKSDVILVSNNSDQTQTIELYAVDGIVTNTGAFTCSQESEAKQGMGSWTTVKKNELTLEAGKTEEVGFDVSMPANADVGEHNGCIVFQVAEDEGEASGNVRIRTRQAIRVVMTVPGDLKRDVEIEKFSTVLADGNQTYTLELKNSGNVSADVDAKVYLTSLFGNVVYENGGGYPVLSDQQLDLTFVNEDRPMFGGWYYASATLAYDKRAGTFGTSDSSQLVKKEADKQLLFLAPTVEGVIIIVLILGLIGGVIAWWLIQRRNRTNALKSWKEYTVQQGDSIQSVANAHNISWKKLASINAIRPPYTLAEHSTLRVPEVKKAASPKSNQSEV